VVLDAFDIAAMLSSRNLNTPQRNSFRRKPVFRALADFCVSNWNANTCVTLWGQGEVNHRALVFWGCAMHHETHDVADKVRSEAHRCWKNATAMYCRASTGGAETRGLYVEIAVCWAALARELEKRLSLAYRDSAARHYHGGGDDGWPTAADEAPALAAADPRSGS
jgi:hypothetical protein